MGVIVVICHRFDFGAYIFPKDSYEIRLFFVPSGGKKFFSPMKKNFPLMVDFYHLPITGIDDDDNDDRGVIYFYKGRAFCRATLLYIIYIIYIK